MTLGARLCRARLEAGLSQRELAGDTVTRNMLSLIENGTAEPSLATLEILAKRLQKPVGYFFGETGETDPMEAAWLALEAGEPDRAEALLRAHSGGSKREREILSSLVYLSLAELTIGEGRLPYGETLLKKAKNSGLPLLDGRRRELLGRLRLAQGKQPEEPLPDLDEALLLRAELCLEGNPDRAGRLLDGAEDQLSPQWSLLRGRVYLREKQYVQAVKCFEAAGEIAPMEAARSLEICCRELGDFERAYFWACRQRETEE